MKDARKTKQQLVQELAELRQELHLYQMAIEKMPLGLTVWDLEDLDDPGSFRLIACNPQIEKATGAPFREFIGTTVRESFPSLLETEGPRIYAEAVRTGQVRELPDLHFPGDEQTAPGVYSVVAVPLRDRLVAVFGQNITDYKRAEEAVREGEERLRLFMESSSAGLALLDSELSYIQVNQAALKMFGMTREQVIGKNILDVSPALKETGRHEEYLEVVATGEPLYVDDLVLDPRFGDVHLRVRAFKVGDGLGLIATDTADRDRAEEQIRSLARFPIENPHPVLRVAADGTILDANAASAPLLELWATQVADTLPDIWRQPIVDSLAAGEPAMREVAVGDRTFSLTLAPVPEAGYVNVYGLDITDRIELEGRLRQAAKMEAVGRLAGGVAHDFNNLLQVINGTCELMLSLEKPEQPLRQDVGEIHAAGQRAAALTRQLLAFSRSQPMQMRIIDLNEVVSGMHSLLDRIIGEDVHLQTRFATRIGSVRADPAGIQQIVLNLAANARDAMPTGGTLTIETREVRLDALHLPEYLGARPGTYVMFSVTDTGVGIEHEIREHLFEPFFTTKEVGQGTGLGLSIVYGTVQDFGGAIDVISEPGQGTAFRIYLPRVEEAVEGPLSVTLDERVPRGSETILVVEDQEDVRRLDVRMLREIGYTVLEASSAREAVRLCQSRSEPIDLVFADVVMPGLSGPQVVERLRALDRDFAVLYTSGYADETIKLRTELRPSDPLIYKPFSIQDLAKRVREVLDGK